jgi:hypothetical protein
MVVVLSNNSAALELLVLWLGCELNLVGLDGSKLDVRVIVELSL